jgi:hypothetical protein
VLDAIAQARSEVAAGKVAVRNSDKV